MLFCFSPQHSPSLCYQFSCLRMLEGVTFSSFPIQLQGTEEAALSAAFCANVFLITNNLTRFEMFYRIRQYFFQQTLKKMYILFPRPLPHPGLHTLPPTTPPWQISPTPTTPVFLGCVLGGAWHPQRFSFKADRRKRQGLHRYPW